MQVRNLLGLVFVTGMGWALPQGGSILAVAPSVTSQVVSPTGEASVRYTLSNTGTASIPSISINPDWQQNGSSLHGLSLNNDHCSGQMIAQNTDCTFDLVISGANQPTQFTVTPKVCGFNGAFCAQPTIANQLAVSISSATLTFSTGDMFFSSAGAMTATIHNSSSTSTTIGTPTLANGTGIAITDPNGCFNTTLAAGGDCSFTLTAAATATTTNNAAATLSITQSAGSSASATASVTLAAPTLSVNGGDPITLNVSNGYSTSVPVSLTGGFDLQGTNIDTTNLPTGASISSNTCTGTLSSSCSFTVSSTNHNSQSGTVGVTGSNLPTEATQNISVHAATFDAQTSRTHLSAEYVLFTNNGADAITINSESVSGSGTNPLTDGQATIMTVDPDTHNDTDLCNFMSSVPGNGGSCKLWVKVTNGPDLSTLSGYGLQTGTVSLNTSDGTFTAQLSASTNLYAEGNNATTQYTGNGEGTNTWTSIASGGGSDRSASKSSLDVLLGSIVDNQTAIGYYNGTPTLGSLGATVKGDVIADGALSGQNNDEYIFADTAGGSQETLDIQNGYGGSWGTITDPNAGFNGAVTATFADGTLYLSSDNAVVYYSTNGTDAYDYNPRQSVGSWINGLALFDNILYAGGIGSPYVQYNDSPGSQWVTVNGITTSVTGLLVWNNTLYAATNAGISKMNPQNTFTQVVDVGQSAQYGFIASTDALYLLQDTAIVQRCTGTGDSMTCTSLGDTGVGELDTWGSNIVIAPECQPKVEMSHFYQS